MLTTVDISKMLNNPLFTEFMSRLLDCVELSTETTVTLDTSSDCYRALLPNYKLPPRPTTSSASKSKDSGCGCGRRAKNAVH